MDKEMSEAPGTSKSKPISFKAREELKKLGFGFNSDGQFRMIDKTTGELGTEPFKYDKSKSDLNTPQLIYGEIGEVLPEVIYELLEENGLTRTYIPEDQPVEQSTFFFTYPGKLNKPKKLLVIIHGSGFVRAGQWSRSLIINNSLDHGSQLPYIKRARDLGYDIVVTNTNDTYRVVDGERKEIEGLNTATLHAQHVWEKYVMACQPEAVAIVAHSAGGAVALDLAKIFPRFFKNNVFAIALTDSVHWHIPENVRLILAGKTCNWVSSSQPLDNEIKTELDDIRVVSAGHNRHEWSSYSAFESVFKYLEKKFAEFNSEEQKAKRTKLGN